MSTYSDASLILPVAPERKAGKIYSLKPTDGTGDFTVSRGTGVTGKRHEINSDLKLEIIDNDVPAFNFDTIGGCPVLNTEPQATNLITYPISFSNAYWTKIGTTIDDNGGAGYSAPSVDFPTSAFKLVEDSATSVHYMSATTLSLTAGGTYVYSFYVKPNGRTVIAHIDWSNATADVVIDIENETISGANTNIIAVNFTNVADGFKRVEISYNLDVAQVQAENRLYLYNGGITYTGDGTSGVYIFMAQLEQGSVATSPTFTDTTLAAEGSTTTRLADVVTGAGDVNTFNSVEGTFFAEISAAGNLGTYRLMALAKDTYNTIFIGYSPTSNQIVGVIYVGGVLQVNMAYTVTDATNFRKVAIKYALNDFALWIDGVEVDTDNSGAVFPAASLDEIQFDDGGGSNIFYGNTKQIQYYNTALSDTELQALTTL